MLNLRQNSRFWRLSIGYISFGIGQHLIRIGVMQPLATRKAILYALGVLGAVLLSVGLFFMLKPVVRLLKHYNQNNRVIIIIGKAILFSVVSAFILGGIGQLIYHYNMLRYQDIKYILWVISSVLQSLIKVVAVYQLCCVYKQKTFKWQNKDLLWIIVSVVLLVVSAIIIGIIWQDISEVLIMIVDTVMILGTIYSVIYKN